MSRKFAIFIILSLGVLTSGFFIIRHSLTRFPSSDSEKETVSASPSAEATVPPVPVKTDLSISPGGEGTAQSVLIEWNPAWDNDLGWAAAPPRPPIDSWLIKKDGTLMRDGKEFIFFGTGLNQASTALDTDYKIQKTLQRIAAQGFNAVRLQGMDAKYMGQMSWNYGAWTDATGPEFSEEFMVRLDKTIATANALGLQVWISGFRYDQAVTRVAKLPTGTYLAHGMGWSSEFRAIEKAYILRFADRVNTQTGVKYIDNPGIVWEPDNENGFSNAYFDHGPTADFDGERWFDQIVDQTNGNGYWKPELDAKIRSYYAAKGWVLPGNQFPKWSTWDSWNDVTDRQHFMQFMADTDLEYAADIYNWFKSLNPKVLVDLNTFNYMDGRVLEITDIVDYHLYSRTPSGDPIKVPPNYTTRSSILQDKNGFWARVMGGSRTESVPLVVAEAGDYGLNRWDYERTILEAIVHCLQRTSGFLVFNESQDLGQATASGIRYIHSQVGWPSRRLAAMLAQPIVEYRLIAPLPEKNVAVIDPAQYIIEETEKKTTGLSSYHFQKGWDGAERGFWLKRIYMSFGTPQNTEGYPKITDEVFNTMGVQVTDQVFVKNTGVIVNAPAVVGLVNDLKNITIGPMILSGVTPTENAVVMIRSDGNYPLFSGPAKLFVHQYSTVTDAAGFTGTVDGETVTGWGSEKNTRLVVPAPFVITFATRGKELNVFGVNDDGSVVPLSTVFNANAGTEQFSTNTRFPLYLVVPRQSNTTNVQALIKEPDASIVAPGRTTLSGYAIDLGSVAGTGIDAVDIYLDGPSGAGTLIGHASYGLSQPDVATRYGGRFERSGWKLTWDTTRLSLGLHKLYLYAHRTTDSRWSEMLPRGIIVQTGGGSG